VCVCVCVCVCARNYRTRMVASPVLFFIFYCQHLCTCVCVYVCKKERIIEKVCVCVCTRELSSAHTNTHFRVHTHSENVCALESVHSRMCVHSSNFQTWIFASPLLLPAPVCLCTCVREREERETQRESVCACVRACALIIVGLK